MKAKHFVLLPLLLAACCFADVPKSFSVSVRGVGRPMILIPGLECPGQVWQGFIEHFQSKYQVHSITLAGFAGEPAVPGLRLVDVKNDLIRYIQDSKLEKPLIVGHSLGGFLALWVGASAPDLVSGIISVDGLPFLPALMNPTGSIEESKAAAEQLRTLYSSLKPEQIESMTKMSVGQMISDPKDADTVVKWAKRSDAAFVGQALYDLLTTDLRTEMAKVRAPLLLIGAGKAFASNPEGLAKVRAAYESQVAGAPQHRVVMAEKALHFIMLDDPDFLFQATGEFLGR